MPSSRTSPTTPTISRHPPDPGPRPMDTRFPNASGGVSQYSRTKFSVTTTTGFRLWMSVQVMSRPATIGFCIVAK
jgi:hypothetical protein